MTNQTNIKTLEDARAEAALQATKAEEDIAFRVFFNQNPEYRCDANKSIFRHFHGNETITLDSLEESFPFVKDRLAIKGQSRIEQESLYAEEERREEFSAMSTDELRKIAYQERGEEPLPDSITSESIREESPERLRFLVKKYGLKMVNLRLAGRK